MVKPRTSYLIDLLLAISFIATAVTALIIFFYLPSGARQGGYQQFLDTTKMVWGGWHRWFGLSFIILAAIHFILHIPWVAAMTKSIFGKKTDDPAKQQ